MANKLHDVRADFVGEPLPENITESDPWQLLEAWVCDAVARGLPEPTAFTLSTVSAAGRPSARAVLLKEYSPDGLVFFTNLESRKAVELAETGLASALFYWPGPMRQLLAVGRATKLDREESAAYFATRPRPSQISAWVSRQSRELDSRAVFEREWAEAERSFAEKEVPMPEHWGGYRIAVDEFEFWQGLPGRAHDRVRFTLETSGWFGTRLYP